MTEEWIEKIRFIYTIKYYSAIKNEDILHFAGKWMELENIILSEVTQTQKDMHDMYSLMSGYYPPPPKNTVFLGYNPQNSRRLTKRRAQVRMPQFNLGRFKDQDVSNIKNDTMDECNHGNQA
jgi:hypothetical protein